MIPGTDPRRGRVCVVGSLNVDHIALIPVFPAPGQTVASVDLMLRHGGKGANQAIAASRQGAFVSMAGALGNDLAGSDYRNRLQDAGIDHGFVIESTAPTGAAFINLIPSGENTIVVAAGANGSLTAEDIESAREAIEKAAVLLVQLEVPLAAVVTAIQIANQNGTRVVFNPSPFNPAFPWPEVFVDVLIVNEGEAEQLDQTTPADGELPIECLVITRGPGPTELISPDGDFVFHPPRVAPVDTVGAGDAFAGTLAARLAFGDALHQAVSWANAAGALSTLRTGAQEAIPDREATEAFLDEPQ